MGDFFTRFFAGIFLVVFGVGEMGRGLEGASFKTLEKVMRTLTKNVYTAFFTGIVLTSVVQSSTAVTLLTVSLVNARLMTLPQAAGVIFGANIGTTMTAQIMALSLNVGISSASYPILGLGLAMRLFGRDMKYRQVGKAVTGFGLLFLGLKLLNEGAALVGSNAIIMGACRHAVKNPLSAFFVGIIMTALLHSSSATVGLVMVMGNAGLLDFKSAVAMILGDNIGTCFTAQLASLGGSINAKRTAWAHTIYNVLGAVAAMMVLGKFLVLVENLTLRFQPTAAMAQKLANAHALFNVASALIFLPFTNAYVKFVQSIIKDDS